jgi:hypothetical protein
MRRGRPLKNTTNEDAAKHRRFEFRVSAEQGAWLSEASERTGVPRSELVRRALALYIVSAAR